MTRHRGPRPKRDRAFRVALVIALVVHLPLAPLPMFRWLRGSPFGHGDYDDPNAKAVVPIDLDILGRDLESQAPAPPPPPAPPPVAAGDSLDGGVPPAHPSAEPKGLLPKDHKPPPKSPAEEARDAGAPTDAGAPAEAAGPKPLTDPATAAGGAGKIAAKDPNVQVLLAGNVLRRHEIGRRLSKLLVSIPEWRGFFKESPLDPIRDFNHVLITAPRLRSDSSKLVAVMDYNVTPAVAHDAIDKVLHQTEGVWLPDAPVEAAKARIAGVPRVLAHVPERHLLVVLPVDAMDQLSNLKQAKPFKSSTEGVVLSMITPAGPLADVLPLPKSIKWMRLVFTPTADGGVDIAADLGDASHDEAVAHAKELTKEVDVRRRIDVGIAVIEVIDHVAFTATGDLIRGRTHVPRNKVDAIMSYVEQLLRQRWGP